MTEHLSVGKSLPSWHIAIEGCWNFRDAGGWTAGDQQMRCRSLYRSDDPLRLTQLGRQRVDSLGIATVIDLRQQSQVDRTAGFLPPHRTFHVPLVDRVIDPANPPRMRTPDDMCDLYIDMIDRSRDRLAVALDLIAEHLSVGSVLVHCSYGKDRAGLVIALVHAAIGLSADSIAADYARSHEPSQRRRAWTLARPLPDDPPTSHVPPYLFSAPAQAMHSLLERMTEQHGSPRQWVASHPIADTTIERLTAGLLTTPGQRSGEHDQIVTGHGGPRTVQ